MILFVTGASAGFGEATVRRFVANGDHVIATARRLDRLEKLQREFGDHVLPLAFDVQNKLEVERAIESLPPSWKNIDVLVNNAGLALGLETAQKASLEDWDVMVDTNVKGLLYCTNKILKSMVARNSGHIINIGSVAGEFPYPGGNVYGATKAFVHQFSLNLRADLLGTAVRVTCIEPGMCSGTEFSDVRFQGDSEKARAVYAGVNALTSEDIAETIFWVTTRPSHMNINVISLMPTQQAFAALALDRVKTASKP
jgi:3-hydroxy acid dehydrogenase/malonic semialdehyde reductase